MGRILVWKISAACLSDLSLIFLSASFISAVLKIAIRTASRCRGNLQAHPAQDAPTLVTLEKYRANRQSVGNPLNEPTFFVKGDNTICSNICGQCECQVDAESNLNSRSCLLRDSELALRSLLMIVLKSIKRASFRRSSLGFPRNMYICPLLPLIVIFRGFAKERMTSISSKISE